MCQFMSEILPARHCASVADAMVVCLSACQKAAERMELVYSPRG